MHILHLASEWAPLAKSGGLGDASSALTRALARRGHRVRAVLPRYGHIDPGARGFSRLPITLEVPLGEQTIYTALWHREMERGLDLFLVEHDALFGRAGLYGDQRGDFGDNDRRFGLWCAAAIALCRRLRWWPDVMHAHDWQAAAGVWQASRRRGGWMRTVFTIHNLGYQGMLAPQAVHTMGLGLDAFRADTGEQFGALNLMKLALRSADHITTVSPRYAREICTPEQGFGLDGLLRARRAELTGILNGVDYDIWDPRTDPHLPATYGPDDLEGKRTNKAALLREFGLDPDVPGALDAPVVGVVSRLAWQKGIDLLLASTPHWMPASTASDPRLAPRLVVLGSGEPSLVDGLRQLGHFYPGRVGVQARVDERLAHLVEAGSDLFVMPSRYEPCGLNQMYSLRYGTVPVVRATGGLDDTVRNYDPVRDEGTGFKFDALEPQALGRTIAWALRTYADTDRFRRLQLRGMKEDFSWERAAQAYEAVYARVGAQDAVQLGGS